MNNQNFKICTTKWITLKTLYYSLNNYKGFVRKVMSVRWFEDICWSDRYKTLKGFEMSFFCVNTSFTVRLPGIEDVMIKLFRNLPKSLDLSFLEIVNCLEMMSFHENFQVREQEVGGRATLGLYSSCGISASLNRNLKF